jgi:hypothetical protein
VVKPNSLTSSASCRVDASSLVHNRSELDRSIFGGLGFTAESWGKRFQDGAYAHSLFGCEPVPVFVGIAGYIRM